MSVPVDATGMTHVHMDVWSPDATAVKLKLVDTGFSPTHEHEETVPISTGSWQTVVIPMETFVTNGLDPSDNITQYIISADGGSTLFVDNFYFYAGVADPTEDPTTVLSIFGTTYGNLAGANFDPGWGQTTDAVAGDEYVLNGLNYQGIDFGANLNVSGYDYLHLDYYTDDSTALNVYLISSGPVETGFALDLANMGQWNSVDIPLTSFTATDLADVIQMKFDGNGTIRVDNIYFGSE
jgi:hypothetical protein